MNQPYAGNHARSLEKDWEKNPRSEAALHQRASPPRDPAVLPVDVPSTLDKASNQGAFSTHERPEFKTQPAEWLRATFLDAPDRQSTTREPESIRRR